MRPLKLKVSGLTCFRDEVVLDLAPLSLVAIAGPTGAGKSTLLDAMILSLYGFVPRMGVKNLGELISHGRSALSVVFDFRVADKDYRVARAIYRNKRASQALLSELSTEDGAGAPKETRIASGVKEVQDQVRTLLGIDGEAFTQAVILPQGRFQDFLKATPGDRRKILNELLGLRIYDLMRVKAHELAVKRGAEIETLEAQLGELADLDTNALSAKETDRIALNATRDAALEAQREARQALTLAETLRGLLSRRSRYLEEAARLDDRRSQVELDRARLARLTEVLPLAAPLERSEDLKVKLAKALRVVEASTAALEKEKRALDQASTAAEEARAAAEAVVLLRARMAELDALKAQVDSLTQEKAALTRATAEAETTQRQFEATTAETQAAQTALLLARTELDARRTHIEGLAFDRDTLTTLNARRDRVMALGHHLRELETHQQALDTSRQQAAEAEDTLLASELERKKKELAEALAEQALNEATHALEQFRRDEAAAALRAHLHPGEACPVCQQTVETVPDLALAGPGIDLAATVAERQKAHQKANAAAERARQQEAGHKARHEAALSALKNAELEVERRTAAITSELHEVLDGATIPTALQAITLFQTRLAELTRAEQALSTATEALERLSRKVIEHEATVSRQTLALDFARQRRDEAMARVTEHQARVDALGSQLKDLDPVSEKKRLERTIETLELAKTTAQDELSKRRSAYAAAIVTLDLHREQADTIAVGLSKLEGELVVKLAALGLTLDTARELADDAEPALLAELGRTIDQYDAARARVAGDLREVDEALGGRTLAPDEVALHTQHLNDATLAWERSVTALATLESELIRLRQQLERVAKVKSQLDEARETHRVYKRLGEDLKSNQFQEYVLEEVNADLAAGASERLLILSGGRYRLGVGKDGYEVFDEDNGGERRSTDTLSGGETFLASLALALELSEQIQRKSGKVHLDCIFIDEGFGTLDAETLETVAEAVEALGSTGRLVGLITHVAELASRMPDRIQVDKTAEGSRLRVLSA